MKSLEIEYSQNVPASECRPIVEFETPNGNIDCIVDTGAAKNIWFGTAETLRLYFPQAENTEYLAEISGLGGQDVVFAPVMRIPVFSLSGGEDVYTIKNMLIAVHHRNFPFLMLLGISNFEKTNISFSYLKSVRKMILEYERDVIYCVPRLLDAKGGKSTMEGKIILDGSDVFASP